MEKKKPIRDSGRMKRCMKVRLDMEVVRIWMMTLKAKDAKKQLLDPKETHPQRPVALA